MSASECVQINCNSVGFNSDCVGIIAINCTGINFNNTQNGQIWIANAVTTKTGSTTASSTVPATVDGQYGMYYIDNTAGNVAVNLGDPAVLKDQTFFFLQTNTTGANVAVFNAYAAENLNFLGMPQNHLGAQGKCISITSDGTDWFIKTSI